MALNISYQNVVDFPDLSENTETDIYIDNNYITVLDYSKLPKDICLLDIRNNNLSELPKNPPDRIKKLYLQNNGIETISELPDKLEILDVSSNGLSSLCALPITIRNVHLSNNFFSNIDFLPLTNTYKFLSSLTLVNNELTEINLKHLSNLRFVSLDDNDIVDINDKLPNNLQEIQMRNNKLTCIKKMPQTLSYMDFQNNDIFGVVCLPRDFEKIQLGNNPLIYNINKYMRLGIKGVCRVILPLRKHLAGIVILNNIRRFIKRKSVTQ